MVHCTGRCKEPQFTARRGLTLTAALCQVNQQYAKQSGYIGNLPTALKGSQHSALLLPVFRQESLNHLPTSFLLSPSRMFRASPSPSVKTKRKSPSICTLYKNRWQVELFKWIKRHLRIKRFYGTSENAVKTQIWIAVSVYVLVAIVKKRLGSDASLYTLPQILSVTLFEKTPLQQAFPGSNSGSDNITINNQLNLFAF